jgi:hypothetical protein
MDAIELLSALSMLIARYVGVLARTASPIWSYHRTIMAIAALLTTSASKYYRPRTLSAGMTLLLAVPRPVVRKEEGIASPTIHPYCMQSDGGSIRFLITCSDISIRTVSKLQLQHQHNCAKS